ncbi:transferase family-domain-containing protein [Achaetomium macrosporum]|uniref:Transferase family-domain-containing protein n=1 Tax=Achaetomium macrosporum TaxID=79813 RepID=A0AAN7HAJ1_9PEZI|nr:transferase family-domain-containing protein [Achaetomium macrosporum]
MAPPQRFPLNAMDNIMPRFFPSLIFAFRLQPGVTHDQALDLLRASLRAAADELPLLRRRAFGIPPTKDNPVAGRLEAREHPDWTPEVLHHDLRASWPDYDELIDEALPQDLLDGAQLLPPGRAHFDLDSPEGVPLLLAQANDVVGGLLLGVSIFHPLADGMSGVLFLRMWAKHMRLLQEGEAISATVPLLEIPPDCCDYELLVKAWQEAGAPVAEGTEADWRVLGLLPPGSEPPAPRVPPPPMRTSIFYVSAAAFGKLTAVAAAANNSQSEGEGSWGEGKEQGMATATANDALMALLWRCIMRARRATAPQDPAYSGPGAVAELDTTLNGRILFGDTLPWQYMGTLVYIVTTRLPVAELVAPETPLVAVVRAVRQAVASITRERALSVFGLAATRLPGYTADTLRWPFATFDGAEACFSSWLSLPAMDMSFGGKLFANRGIPDYIRPERRLLDLVCRNCNILPMRMEGGAEVLVSLTVEEMALLEQDPEFAQFAQLLCH